MWLIFTHPVNNFWLKGHELRCLGAGFFALGQKRCSASAENHPVQVWTSLRNRWEYSHVARAVLASFALIAFIVAVAI
ncbi:MAG TPA: hypothetical protein VK540_32685 [Polyangiaceae bacterium]|nr:hypothetical protein [Polyangiaceae bacterium]